jgi:hypothetical protein
VVTLLPEGERSGPPQAAPTPTHLAPIVSDRRAVERSRRSRRWARRELDDLLGVPLPALVEVDYHASGLDLGFPERRAAGIALLERERAA